MIADRPVLGISFMLGFCVLAPMGDATAKLLGETIPLAQLLLVRFAAQALLISPVIWWAGGTLAMSRRVFRLTVLRTGLHVVAIGAMFTSLRFLPLADAVAIAFVMPFVMLLLGRVVLGEEVGARRLIACTVGFVGTLLVVQPSFAEVGLPALLPLIVAVFFALFMLVTRHIAKETGPLTLQAVSGLIATVMLAGLLVVGWGRGWPVFALVAPGPVEGLLLVAIGVIGTLAHLMMSWALRFAPSATLAPMQYLEIPFATLIGWVIFRDLPDGLAAVGIAITIGAGLYIVLREQGMARAAVRKV